jgi:hypothetical protein
MQRRKELTGRRFGRLLVLRFAGIRKSRTRWFCRCDCGKDVVVRADNLLAGETRSCGCYHLDMLRWRSRTHGDTVGYKLSKEYRVWMNMKGRCLYSKHTSYKNYGGRGVRVCKRWLNSFEDFLADVGRAPGPEYTIDRIDNDGNYEPGNVRWATWAQQTNNKRKHKTKRTKTKRQ